MFYSCDFELILVTSEPFESQTNPKAKSEDKIIKMAEAIMEKVVTQLLNEAAEVVLKED
jgi:hypothetical protein